MDDAFLERTEALLMDATLDPDVWPVVLDAVSKAAGAKGLALLTVDGCGPKTLTSPNLLELAERYVDEGWYRRDYRYVGLAKLRRTGYLVDQDILTPDKRRMIPFYTDWLDRVGLGWFAGVKVATGEHFSCLGFQRGLDRGPFEEVEQEALMRLGPLLSRTVSLSAQLELARLEGRLDAAEAIGTPCFMLDRLGRVSRMNGLAAALINDVFVMRKGGLHLIEGPNPLFARLVEAAVQRRLPADHPALLPVLLQRRAGPPLAARVVRLGVAAGPFAPAVAMLLVDDAKLKTPPEARALSALFGLTPAEAKLVVTLSTTHSLTEAAASLGRGHETARSQLRSIFAKTGTNSQTALIQLLERLR